MQIASLTTTCAEVSGYWSRDVLDIDLGWRVTVFLLVIIIINVLGVKVCAGLPVQETVLTQIKTGRLSERSNISALG